MADTPQNPTQDSQQKVAAENQAQQMSTAGRITPQQGDPDPNASGNPEATSTQENLGDGAGIRGDYGNASQTNGSEGGPNSPEDADADAGRGQ